MIPFKFYLRAILTGFLFYSAILQAQEIRKFESDEQQQRYQNMIEQLRCLVCQNQNLADSDAELAQDLRSEIFSMITSKNKTDEEIIGFMVERYGDFVLYNPPLKRSTVLLWFGPFILLSIGILVLVIYLIRRNEKQTGPSPVSEQDRSRLKQLLQDTDNR